MSNNKHVLDYLKGDALSCVMKAMELVIYSNKLHPTALMRLAKTNHHLRVFLKHDNDLFELLYWSTLYVLSSCG